MQVALHMRATRTFTDRNGVTHRNGEEWLIKMEDTEAHIPDVYEEVRAKSGIIIVPPPSIILSCPSVSPLPISLFPSPSPYALTSPLPPFPLSPSLHLHT